MGSVSRVAVMGASGCVGRQVCAAFAHAGHPVVAVSRRPASHLAAYRFRSLDLASVPPERLARVLDEERCDVVVNVTGGWGSTPEAMRHDHIGLTGRLVRAVAAAGRGPRLVHLGTIHEYGPVPDGAVIDESVPPAPVTEYARTKLAGSRSVLDATARGEIDGVVLRAVNLCGPYPAEPSFPGFLLRRLRAAAAGDDVLELTVASAHRDYLDVRDAADAIRRAATTDAAVTGQVVNIGRGEAVPMRELVRMAVAAAGIPSARVRLVAQPVDSKGGDWTLAGIRRAEQLIKWRPRIGLAASLSAMWGSEST
ncbi:NAD-dependent epimerase/dehydratase [Micromonospora sp. BRA006-A]|uniref:NAD-dependent epimerase/dehydratase family protein n=1 Tax=Micromonospora sp. BRA006-A TaxID=2962860 RepID=UPI00296E9E93|nr:NAD-dependent epimerase/dehydratase [Micromonospora sp. BRA006-A]MDW3848655.1 NAD-dependent epimerase/dehydratase [Micromonospora sp. BRA006-A]